MCNKERKPHVHAELIKAWADGCVIEYYSGLHSKWFEISNHTPIWCPETKYRIKPEQTDLEKYGVEKGDVWDASNGALIIVKSIHTKKETLESVSGLLYGKKELAILRFRRGVVDKL